MNKELKLELHRKESPITCPETCWCWDYEVKIYYEQQKQINNISKC